MEKPILSVLCKEPEGEIIRNVYELNFTMATIDKLTEQILKFPTLYGKEIKNKKDVLSMFFNVNGEEITPKGIFYSVDDMVGLFYITDFCYDFSDALVHYTFFDRRHNGRVPLVRSMLKYVFERYNFQRLSVELPLYMTGQSIQLQKRGVITFIQKVGFSHEGRKRKAAFYKGEWFDMNLYGILRGEINGSAKN